MAVQPLFAQARIDKGMYESFYLRAVSPEQPLGAWIRYTVHKRPGHPPHGSLWCTFFDAARGAPFMRKHTTPELSVPASGWIQIGAGERPGRKRGTGAGATGEVQGGRIGPTEAEGICGPARWSLRISAIEPELRHLKQSWLYRAPLPRTKLTSPAPLASFDGTIELPGRTIELRGWHGMVGHNWGSEHAERWIWLHGVDLVEDGAQAVRHAAPHAVPHAVRHAAPHAVPHAVRHAAPHAVPHAVRNAAPQAVPHAAQQAVSHAAPQAVPAWLDVALGRVLVAGRPTPWLASGAIWLDGRRIRLGGLAARGVRVAESAARCSLTLPGENGLVVEAHVDNPPGAAAGWRYADPVAQETAYEDEQGSGRERHEYETGREQHRYETGRDDERNGEHDVVNCSIARLSLNVRPRTGAGRTLYSDHGAAYELGMRERDHGVPLAPFADG